MDKAGFANRLSAARTPLYPLGYLLLPSAWRLAFRMHLADGRDSAEVFTIRTVCCVLPSALSAFTSLLARPADRARTSASLVSFCTRALTSTPRKRIRMVRLRRPRPVRLEGLMLLLPLPLPLLSRVHVPLLPLLLVSLTLLRVALLVLRWIDARSVSRWTPEWTLRKPSAAGCLLLLSLLLSVRRRAIRGHGMLLARRRNNTERSATNTAAAASIVARARRRCSARTGRRVVGIPRPARGRAAWARRRRLLLLLCVGTRPGARARGRSTPGRGRARVGRRIVVVGLHRGQFKVGGGKG